MNLKQKIRIGLGLALVAWLPLSLRAEKAPATYDACLEEVLASLVSPLIDVQAHSKKPHIGVAVLGFREAESGQRSPLAERLERDLSAKIKSGTVFKVPRAYDQKKALESQGGAAVDLSQTATLEALGKALNADAVLSGTYHLDGGRLVLSLRLLRAATALELWASQQSFPSSDLQLGDLDLVAGSRPATYSAPAVAAGPPNPAAAAENLSPSAKPKLLFQPRALADEGAFSWNRISLGAGFKGFSPQNESFRGVTGNLRGGYFNLSWADVVSAEFDIWMLGRTGLSDVGSLFAYGVNIAATAPLRLGDYVILYGGLGGRFESIELSGTRLPPGDAVSFGNNSAFAIGGLKAHIRSWGINTSVSDDFVATYTGYLSVKTGLYYEFNL